MRESQKIRTKIIKLSSLVMLLIFTKANLSVARPRPCVYVELDSETHITLAYRLKLTYHIPPTDRDRPLTVSLTPGPVEAGAGLVFQHIDPNGTTATYTLEPQPWWFSKAEKVQIKSSPLETRFHLWAQPGIYIDLPELGIYHISYVHPWAEPEEDPNSLLFRSNTLTIMRVTEQRGNQLYEILQQNPELALASYEFKNPPVIEMPKHRRSVPKIIDEAIKIGVGMDEVLLLLGSPDIAGHMSANWQKIYGYDDEWFYETSPVGGYYIDFKNGCVVRKGYHADCSGDCI
jgi:hypothetical protein